MKHQQPTPLECTTFPERDKYLEKCLTIFYFCYLGWLYIQIKYIHTRVCKCTSTCIHNGNCLLRPCRTAWVCLHFSSQSHMFSYCPPWYSINIGALHLNNLYKIKLHVYMNFNWNNLKVLSRNVQMYMLSSRAILSFPCSYNYYFAPKVVLFKPMEWLMKLLWKMPNNSTP